MLGPLEASFDGQPLVLGGGKQLFGDASAAKSLRLVDSRPVGPDGVVILTYQPAGDDA